MWLKLVVFLLLLMPLALAANIVDQNKIGIVGGGDVNSSSFEIQVAIEQFTIGEVNSTSYTTQIGWIYTLLSESSITINVTIPGPDANINSNPVVTFDVNKNTLSDINRQSITVDINGVKSAHFDYDNNCTEFDGEFHCNYLETDLNQGVDGNISFGAANDANEQAQQVDRIVHFDVTAPTIISVSAASSGSNVVVTWDGNDTFTGIESFYVMESTGSWVETGSSKSYTFSGHASASHTYRVKARDYADNNSLISEASYTAPTAETPEEPVVPGGGPGLPSVGPIEEEIFDIKIVRVDDPVEVGEKFDFTYIVSNNTRSSGNAYVEYWLELNGEKPVSGSETVYLLAGEEKEISEHLLLLQQMEGNYEFYLRLTKEDQDPVEKTRASQIMLGAPTAIDLNISSLEPGDETQPLRFSIEVGSNRDETLPVLIEERVYTEGKIVWEKKQTVPITAFQRFFEEVHGLEAGQYIIEIDASYKDATKRVAQQFEKKKKAEVVPFIPPGIEPIALLFDILPWIIALLLAIALLLLLRRYMRRKEGKHSPLSKWKS